MRVELHPDAVAELRSAAIWYDEQRDGLGEEFTAELMATLAEVASSPAASPHWPDVDQTIAPVRRAVVSRFPYLVAFEAREECIFVLAIAHQKRRPLYWLARVADVSGRGDG